MNLLTCEFLKYVIRLKFSVTVYFGISYDLFHSVNTESHNCKSVGDYNSHI